MDGFGDSTGLAIVTWLRWWRWLTLPWDESLLVCSLSSMNRFSFPRILLFFELCAWYNQCFLLRHDHLCLRSYMHASHTRFQANLLVWPMFFLPCVHLELVLLSGIATWRHVIDCFHLCWVISLMISMIFGSYDSSITLHGVHTCACTLCIYTSVQGGLESLIVAWHYRCFIMMSRWILWILMHAVIWTLSSLVMMYVALAVFAINFCHAFISDSDFILEAGLSIAQNTEWKVVPRHRSNIQGMCTHFLSNYIL